MLRLWIIAAACLHAVSCSCPGGYTLQFNGICTNLEEDGVYHSYSNLHSDAVDVCSEHAATPVLIRNQEEQDYWASISKQYEYPMVLGLRCNDLTTKWEWDDGSMCPKTVSPTGTPAGRSTPREIGLLGILMTTRWVGLSTACHNCLLITPDIECGDFTGEDGDCYQVGVSAETWIDAQTICKSFGGNLATIHSEKENSHIRRLAVSRGLVNGVLIGSTISGKSDSYSWIDGTSMDYSNFMPGFPSFGMGDCVAMDTNETGGHWVNVNCTDKMAYACVRRAADIEPTCGNHIYSEGEVIHSPGFPSNASIPCDFFLKVEPGMLVEVEILLLEANSCCDHLVLAEGSIGGAVIANLTGEKSSGAKYRTTSSNMMRSGNDDHLPRRPCADGHRGLSDPYQAGDKLFIALFELHRDRDEGIITAENMTDEEKNITSEHLASFMDRTGFSYFTCKDTYMLREIVSGMVIFRLEIFPVLAPFVRDEFFMAMDLLRFFIDNENFLRVGGARLQKCFGKSQEPHDTHALYKHPWWKGFGKVPNKKFIVSNYKLAD